MAYRGTVLTLRSLNKILRTLRQSKAGQKHGKQTMRQLARQNRGMSSIEISKENIKGFEKTARKYSVDFALKKDGSRHLPVWFVFFKAQDADALNAAFGEFTRKMMSRNKEKPSVLADLAKFKAMIQNAVKGRTKNKEISSPER